MTARLASLPKAAQVALVATALLLVALIGYFALIAPKHSTAASLKKQTAAVQSRDQQQPLVRVHAGAAGGASRERLQRVAGDAEHARHARRAHRAQPAGEGLRDLVRPDHAGRRCGAARARRRPAPRPEWPPTATGDPFAAEPIQAKFTGSFYNLLAFLQRVRNHVRVQNGKLFTAGRLFDVSGVTFAEGPQGWPQVSATLVINEFVPQSTAPATTPGTTDTTSTTTTATTTSSGTSAAPSTSGGTS